MKEKDTINAYITIAPRLPLIMRQQAGLAARRWLNYVLLNERRSVPEKEVMG
jgi:hypothetical protein